MKLDMPPADASISIPGDQGRYERMISEIKDYAILLLNVDGTILNWNEGAQKIKGYREDEIIGKNFSIFYPEEDKLINLPGQLIKKAREEGRAMHEGWRIKKDGSRFWGSIVITALHDDNNNVIGFSKVTRDLTEKKLMDDQLRQYAHDLEIQNKALEEFAYVTSHDLQEPLRKILMFTSLLETNRQDEKAFDQNIDRIRNAATKMSKLITDILQYSQLLKTDELFIPSDLNEAVRSAIDNNEVRIHEKNVKIESGNLPVIEGIPVQLQQLFSNLISNSIKFSNENPVIKITCEKPGFAEINELPDTDSEYVKIIFQDNGQGFEAMFVPSVFKLFKKLDDKKPGSGIGLAVCKKIIENHRGSIRVESEPGKGATFHMLLPRTQKKHLS